MTLGGRLQDVKTGLQRRKKVYKAPPMQVSRDKEVYGKAGR